MTHPNQLTNNLINHWNQNKDRYLKMSIFLMTILSVIWMSHHFIKFNLGTSPIWKISHWGTGDLLLRHAEIKSWFSGLPVYDSISSAIYPPASYVILWPLLVFDNMIIIKTIWTSIYLVCAVALSFIFVKYSNLDTKLEKVLAALIPLTTYSLGTSVGIGQITLIVITLLLISLLILKDDDDSNRNRFLIPMLFLFCLVKPSITAPFFWIAIFLPKNLRPAISIVTGYILLTLIASYFQHDNAYILVNKWLNNSSNSLRDFGSSQYFDLHYLLIKFGKEDWRLQGSLTALLLSGIWIYRNKNADIWILIGVMAMVSRFWTYHNWYDDLLLIIPAIPLLRITKSNNFGLYTKVCSFVLLILLCIANIAPGGLYMLPEPFKSIYIYSQLVILFSVMVFLITIARLDRNTESI